MILGPLPPIPTIVDMTESKGNKFLASDEEKIAGGAAIVKECTELNEWE